MTGFSIQELAELLSGPIGSGMIRYIAVEDPPRTNLDHDKDVQDLKRRGHRGEKVTGDDVTCMIVNERRPTLPGRLPRTPTLFQVLADGARIDEQTQFERQLVCDSSFSPTRIRLRHRRDKCAQVLG